MEFELESVEHFMMPSIDAVQAFVAMYQLHIYQCLIRISIDSLYAEIGFSMCGILIVDNIGFKYFE